MKLTKTIVASILCTLVCGFANVALADNLKSSILACSTETNSTQRLQCYDELSKGLKTAKPQQPLVVVSQTPTNQPPQIQADKQSSLVESFGLSNKPDPKEEVADIAALVTNVELDPFKKLLVSLDLGQVWQQIDSTRMRLREGDSVRLERGALGSFFLGVEGKTRRMRVKRIK